jgi:hypothetical protein
MACGVNTVIRRVSFRIISVVAANALARRSSRFESSRRRRASEFGSRWRDRARLRRRRVYRENSRRIVCCREKIGQAVAELCGPQGEGSRDLEAPAAFRWDCHWDVLPGFLKLSTPPRSMRDFCVLHFRPASKTSQRRSAPRWVADAGTGAVLPLSPRCCGRYAAGGLSALADQSSHIKIIFFVFCRTPHCFWRASLCLVIVIQARQIFKRIFIILFIIYLFHWGCTSAQHHELEMGMNFVHVNQIHKPVTVTGYNLLSYDP